MAMPAALSAAQRGRTAPRCRTGPGRGAAQPRGSGESQGESRQGDSRGDGAGDNGPAAQAGAKVGRALAEAGGLRIAADKVLEDRPKASQDPQWFSVSGFPVLSVSGVQGSEERGEAVSSMPPPMMATAASSSPVASRKRRDRLCAVSGRIGATACHGSIAPGWARPAGCGSGDPRGRGPACC